MANDLTKFMGQRLARALEVYRKKATLLNRVGRTYDKTPGGLNSSVEIPSVLPGVVEDFTPSATYSEAPDSNTAMDYLLIDRHKHTRFKVSDREMDQLNPDFFDKRMTQAVEDLISTINVDIWSTAYKQSYNTVGTIGTIPFTSNDVSIATGAWERLSRSSVPDGDRVAILDTQAYATAIGQPAFYQQYSSANPEIMQDGYLGRKFGFDWLYDQQATRHTAGTGTGYLVNSASVAVGNTTVPIDTGTGTLVPGDIFTVAGDSQQYVVNSYSAPTLTFAPSARVAWADNAAITRIASHNVSLAFHSDAIQFATRPLDSAARMHNELGGKKYMNMTDPISNIDLQLRIISQNGQFEWQLHQVYGLKNVRPAATVRIIS
jgi:hypothetical protein